MDLRRKKSYHRLLYYLYPAGKILLLGLVLVYGICLVYRIDLSRLFPITTVRVYGIQHIAPVEVKQLLIPLVRHGFFNTDIEYIRDQLLQLPWVSDINVQRHWPDHMDVMIVEKNAVAAWNQESLLSASGELYMPDRHTYPQDLPQLIGPRGEQMLMLQHLKDIDRLLYPLHVKILRLELTSYRTWTATLDNGIDLQMGHKDILTRLAHFVKVYPKMIGDRAKDVEYVDLRYPNGMAVRWRAPFKFNSGQLKVE